VSRASFTSVLFTVASRRVRLFLGNRAISLPYFAMPLLFLALGGGGLSSLANVPAFDYPSGYTTFFFVYVLLQGSAFAGAAAGAAVASDFETGFVRRLLIAAPHPSSVIAGYILGSVVLALVLMFVLTVVGVAVGVAIGANLLELAGLYGLALLLTVIAALWATGFALRTRITRAQTSASMPIFLVLMLSPAFVTRALLSSWLRVAADYNPYTAVLESSRSLISGEPDKIMLAFAIALALVAAFSLWTLSGLRQALRST
jgi:ABC-2 type transport system permease protein